GHHGQGHHHRGPFGHRGGHCPDARGRIRLQRRRSRLM
ncbi:MAG: hypothetical protein AVDCRST_MAG29-1124, partial [uncultured Nocardioidaceae bacterium]